MIGFYFKVSPYIGTGHARRSAVLAQELNLAGRQIILFADKTTIEFSKSYMPSNTQYIVLQNNIDAFLKTVAKHNLKILIVDNYNINTQIEIKLKKLVSKLMVIDDFTDRLHCCDILLDQNIGRTATDWLSQKNTKTQLLVGAKYALLRPEFHKFRSQLNSDNDKPKIIFICFGGVDMRNITLEVTEALLNQFKNQKIKLIIAIGSGSLNLDKLITLTKTSRNTTLHIDCNEIANLMSKATIAIGAPGTMTLERGCLHLPSILVSLASNQIENGIVAKKLGIAYYLGDYDCNIITPIIKSAEELLFDKRLLLSMRNKASIITDGLGATRVANHLLSHT